MPMTIADKITALRLFLAPLFFALYLLTAAFPALLAPEWTVAALWAIFVLSELTDLLDGYAARRLNAVSGFGKLFDPFADTLTQITCFLCFVREGIFPSPLFLLVIYREFSVLFLRNLMLRKGVTLGAGLPGKIKTVTYILAGALALLALSLSRLGLTAPLPAARAAAQAVFGLSLVFSVYSFLVYLRAYRKA